MECEYALTKLHTILGQTKINNQVLSTKISNISFKNVIYLQPWVGIMYKYQTNYIISKSIGKEI